YRFATTTGVEIRYNLTDAAIVSRDGATGTVAGNITNAQPTWFVNAAVGDLHLNASATAAINHAPANANATTDYDDQSRAADAAPDVGADEFVAAGGNAAPPPNSDPYIVTSYLKIPNFGAHPTIRTIASGNWSNAKIWSAGRVPAAGDLVSIDPGYTVTYDVNSTAALNTLEIQATGTLTFRTDLNTHLVVGNFLVLEGGSLVVGTAANPIAPTVQADIDIADQAINTSTDPQQFGTGLIVLGDVTMHGATRTPFATLAQEPHAGDTALHFAPPVTGWQAGDDPLLPDTRTLPGDGATGYVYQPQWERVTVQSVSADGLTVFLT